MGQAVADRHDRIFTRDRRRHFRRRYSLMEVRYSLLVFLGLAALVLWIAYRGAHPDPSLFAVDIDLLASSTAAQPKDVPRTGHVFRKERGKHPASDLSGLVSVIGPTWAVRSIDEYAADEMYKKINGRAGYFISFDCTSLLTATLSLQENDDVSMNVEVYVFDKPEGALGAYMGERQADTETDVRGGSVGHIARNALFLVRGRRYVRAIGSNESSIVRQALVSLRRGTNERYAGEKRSWAYELLSDKLGYDAGKVEFTYRNAFSFGFANKVYTVEADEQGTRLFVSREISRSIAVEIAKKYADGFSSLGPCTKSRGLQWCRSRFAELWSTARSIGPMVVGVSDAPNVKRGVVLLGRFLKAVKRLAAVRDDSESRSDPGSNEVMHGR